MADAISKINDGILSMVMCHVKDFLRVRSVRVLCGAEYSQNCS